MVVAANNFFFLRNFFKDTDHNICVRPDDELTEQTIKDQLIVRERLGKVSHYCYYPREGPDLTLGSQDMICNIYMYNIHHYNT